MRAVLDPNVLISALLSPTGAPARVVDAWLNGRFDLVVSPLLLADLERALGYPKLVARTAPDDAALAVDLFRREAVMRADPTTAPAVASEDPGDDYLIVLAAAEHAVLVSGDNDLLGLRGRIPVMSPAEFLLQISDS